MSLPTVLVGMAAAYAALWLFQGVMLYRNDEPFLVGYLQFPRSNLALRWTGRIVQQGGLIVLLVAVPLAVGVDPVDAFARAYPLPAPWREIGLTAAVVVGIGTVACVIGLLIGIVRYEPQHERRIRREKMIRRFIYPVPLAMLEEGVFRFFILEALLTAWPDTVRWQAVAIAVAAVAFSAAHFVRPIRPILQPAFGLFVFGCVLGLAYLLGGRTLWLAVTAHACAIFVNEQIRLQTVYQGPRWMVGRADFGYSGLFGIPFVIAIGVVLWLVI